MHMINVLKSLPPFLGEIETCTHSVFCKVGNTLAMRQTAHRTLPHRDGICLELFRGSVACLQLSRLVWHVIKSTCCQILLKDSDHTAHEWGTPRLVLTLMDWQPMAQVAQRIKQTEHIRTRQNWPYTLVRRGAPRLPHSVRGLPRRKCIPGLRNFILYKFCLKHLSIQWILSAVFSPKVNLLFQSNVSKYLFKQ